jgi:hypothetical protein
MWNSPFAQRLLGLFPTTPVETGFMFLVQGGCIPPLCAFLTANDPKTVAIALEGIKNILKDGQRSTVVERI